MYILSCFRYGIWHLIHRASQRSAIQELTRRVCLTSARLSNPNRTNRTDVSKQVFSWHTENNLLTGLKTIYLSWNTTLNEKS